MRQLLAVSIELAVRGGDRLWSIRKGHSSSALDETVKGKTKEGAKELLTKGDLESHRIIRYGFSRAFPQLKVVSEEHDTANPLESDFTTHLELPPIELSKDADNIPLRNITVWIDPLDATQEYTENLLHYVTTMVCVAVNGQPTIGVIYQPFNKLTVWGYVGHGVSTNVINWLKSPKPTEKEPKTKVIVSRSHAGDVEKVVKTALGDKIQVIAAGGAGYKVLQLVNSSVDAYVHTTAIKKWDICAGNAILNALRGQMTTLNGQFIDYSETYNPKNDKGLLATLRNHDKFLQIFSTEFSKTHT
jgi:inositol monophosphatase 3